MKKIIVRIEGKDWQEALDNAFQKENEKVTMDGFRKGKAPKEAYLKKYGIGSLLMPAAELKFEEAYVKMLTDNKDLEIVAKPQGNITKLEESGVEYEFSLVLRPEVVLKKYKNLGIKKEAIKVTKEEVEAELDKMLSHYAEMVIKEEKAQQGDVVVIDFEGLVDGKPFEGGKGEGYSLELGSNTFIPGFEEELIGMKANDEKSFEIKFPDNYPTENLKGKTTTFKVTVKEVKEKKKRELDAEFFKDLGLEGIESKEALLKQLEENIKTNKESQNENEYITKLFDAAMEDMKVEIPDQMVEEEVDRIIENYAEQLKTQGIELAKYYEMTKSTEADMRKMVQPEASKRVKTRFLLEEIAKKENVEATDKEANDLLVEMAAKHQMSKEELEKIYGGLEPLRYEIKMRKAIDILKG